MTAGTKIGNHIDDFIDHIRENRGLFTSVSAVTAVAMALFGPAVLQAGIADGAKLRADMRRAVAMPPQNQPVGRIASKSIEPQTLVCNREPTLGMTMWRRCYPDVLPKDIGARADFMPARVVPQDYRIDRHGNRYYLTYGR